MSTPTGCNQFKHAPGCGHPGATGGPAESGVVLSPADAPFLPAVPLTARDVEVLAVNKGRFRDGYDSDDINRVLGQLESARLSCVWDYFDDIGYGGNSEFVGVAMTPDLNTAFTAGLAGARKPAGSWRTVHPDVWEYLSDPDSDLDPESIPSLLSDEVFPGVDIEALGGDGFHNLAVFDQTGPACEVCGEQTDNKNSHGTLVCLDCVDDEDF